MEVNFDRPIVQSIELIDVHRLNRKYLIRPVKVLKKKKNITVNFSNMLSLIEKKTREATF